MAHAFDTLLSQPMRTIVINGAITALAGLKKTAGGYLANVLPFGGVVRTWTDIDGVENLYKCLEGQAPAIAIALGGRDINLAGTNGFGTKSDLEVLVYFASDNARDLLVGRHTSDAVSIASNTADPGLHVMMEHAEELLIGQRFGASAIVKMVKPEREDELLTRENLTIWLQTYRLTLTRSVKEWRSVSQLLDSIRTRTIAEDGEVELPTAATKPTTIDANLDTLPP